MRATDRAPGPKPGRAPVLRVMKQVAAKCARESLLIDGQDLAHVKVCDRSRAFRATTTTDPWSTQCTPSFGTINQSPQAGERQDERSLTRSTKDARPSSAVAGGTKAVAAKSWSGGVGGARTADRPVPGPATPRTQ